MRLRNWRRQGQAKQPKKRTLAQMIAGKSWMPERVRFVCDCDETFGSRADLKTHARACPDVPRGAKGYPPRDSLIDITENVMRIGKAAVYDTLTMLIVNEVEIERGTPSLELLRKRDAGTVDESMGPTQDEIAAHLCEVAGWYGYSREEVRLGYFKLGRDDLARRRATMTPIHPAWEAFTERLGGPDACRFDGSAFNCSHDFRFASAILASMPGVDVQASLDYFASAGGCCDCEVLLNVAGSDYSEGLEVL